MPPLCALVGALLIGYPMQRFGRRTALIGICIPFFIGFLLMGLTFYGRHKAMLFVGRLFTALMNGAFTPASQIYVSILNLCIRSISDAVHDVHISATITDGVYSLWTAAVM